MFIAITECHPNGCDCLILGKLLDSLIYSNSAYQFPLGNSANSLNIVEIFISGLYVQLGAALLISKP